MASAIDTEREASPLLISLPSASATSSGAMFASGEFGICLARRSSSSRIASAVAAIPLDTEAAIHDPPSTGEYGRLESPSLMLMFSSGSPRMAVGAQHDTHSDRPLQRVPDAGRHAPADQVAGVPHRPWLRIAPVPPKRLGALAVAFAQRLTAERPIVVLIALRITSQAKFERIDLERDRKFVHRAFERVDAGRGAWTAHVARRRQVEPSELVHVLRVRGLVE